MACCVGRATVTRTTARTAPTRALIRASPADSPVTTPAGLTAATAPSLVDQWALLRVAAGAADPSASRPVSSTTKVCPGASRMAPGLIRSERRLAGGLGVALALGVCATLWPGLPDHGPARIRAITPATASMSRPPISAIRRYLAGSLGPGPPNPGGTETGPVGEDPASATVPSAGWPSWTVSAAALGPAGPAVPGPLVPGYAPARAGATVASRRRRLRPARPPP